MLDEDCRMEFLEMRIAVKGGAGNGGDRNDGDDIRDAYKDPLYPFSSSSFPSTPLAQAVIASPHFPDVWHRDGQQERSEQDGAWAATRETAPV